MMSHFNLASSKVDKLMDPLTQTTITTENFYYHYTEFYIQKIITWINTTTLNAMT